VNMVSSTMVFSSIIKYRLRKHYFTHWQMRQTVIGMHNKDDRTL